MSSLFCFGMGYSASALARRLAKRGWTIAGTSRSPDGVAAIRDAGFRALLFDGAHPAQGVRDALAVATHVVVSPAPDEGGDPVLRVHAGDLEAAASVRWIGYLSTIGVYGDTDGAWLDEDTPARPGSPRTRRRVEAEENWLAFAARTGKRVQVFRLGGIYGPGRSAIDDIREGTARRIVKPGQVFNRIHVDDIANVLAAAIEKQGRHDLYNVTDDEPAPPQDVIAFAAELLGRAPPPALPFETADLSPMARSFYSENRRVGNARIKNDLGVRLAYPSYREGLAAILESGKAS